MCLALDRGRPGFVRNFTCSVLLGCLSKRPFYFTYEAFTLYGSIFQLDSVIKRLCNSFGVLQDSATGPSTPFTQRLQAWHVYGLGCAPFAHHYLGYLLRFLFLRVLRCFTSPGQLLPHYEFMRGYQDITPGGLPHSEIPGSMDV